MECKRTFLVQKLRQWFDILRTFNERIRTLGVNMVINTFLLMIYEINHIWTAEMKWKWRNDRRIERNLCNCVKKPEKISGLQRGLNPWPRNTGAMLYQLSYEATDVGSRSVVGSYVSVNIFSFFFSGFFTQLHKLRSLRRSFLHFHNTFLY